jgi:hypothetical protein
LKIFEIHWRGYGEFNQRENHFQPEKKDFHFQGIQALLETGFRRSDSFEFENQDPAGMVSSFRRSFPEPFFTVLTYSNHSGILGLFSVSG